MGGILASVSPVWRLAIVSDLREAETATIDIPDADPVIAQALIRFAYLGQLEQAHAAQVLPFAHRYQIDQLVGLCVEMIQRSITSDNIVDVLELLSIHLEHEKVEAVWPTIVQMVRNDP